MKMSSLFNSPTHRVFDLKPRYYNPNKERLATNENNSESQKANNAKDRIRQHFERRKKQVDHAGARSSLIRVAVIACLLTIFIFWMFN